MRLCSLAGWDRLRRRIPVLSPILLARVLRYLPGFLVLLLVGLAAVIPFRSTLILTPMQFRLMLVGLSFCLGIAVWVGIALQRRQRQAMEQLRQRVATDLHDDLGTNLSRIAMLSEVIQQRLATDDPEIRERLLRVATISRESVESLSDIVWAIHPERDRLCDLLQRMRRIADDFCAVQSLQFDFQILGDDWTTTLTTEMRRELLLIFKEALNNIARHAQCQRVEITIQHRQHELQLQVWDDGKGFVVQADPIGNGLRSLQVRAKRLKGSVQIQSAPRLGTLLLLRVPLTTGHWHRGVAIHNETHTPRLPRRKQRFADKTYIPV